MNFVRISYLIRFSIFCCFFLDNFLWRGRVILKNSIFLSFDKYQFVRDSYMNRFYKYCWLFFFFGCELVHLPKLDDEMIDTERLARLKLKLEEQGIKCGSCQPGRYSRMICPQVPSAPL